MPGVGREAPSHDDIPHLVVALEHLDHAFE